MSEINNLSYLKLNLQNLNIYIYLLLTIITPIIRNIFAAKINNFNHNKIINKKG